MASLSFTSADFSRHHHASGLQHVGMIGELEGEGCILLHQQHAHLGLAVDAAHDAKDLLHDERSQPEGGLVQQHQPRAQHQRAADRQHLLLAAGQGARLLAHARLEDGKVFKHHGQVALRRRLVLARIGSHPQVFTDAQIGESAAALRHVPDAEADDVLGRLAGNRLPVESDRALGSDHAADGAQCGGLAGSIGAEQSGNAAELQGETDVVQGLRLAVECFETLGLEQRGHLTPPFRDRPGSLPDCAAPPPGSPRRSSCQNQWQPPCRTPTSPGSCDAQPATP